MVKLIHHLWLPLVVALCGCVPESVKKESVHTDSDVATDWATVAKVAVVTPPTLEFLDDRNVVVTLDFRNTATVPTCVGSFGFNIEYRAKSGLSGHDQLVRNRDEFSVLVMDTTGTVLGRYVDAEDITVAPGQNVRLRFQGGRIPYIRRDVDDYGVDFVRGLDNPPKLVEPVSFTFSLSGGLGSCQLGDIGHASFTTPKTKPVLVEYDAKGAKNIH